ncbi:MAG TPA: arylamine N-acetyltransferase [Burkholderiales bacterium]|nr:arylamine N-acetyltransferase [Burkholderiales bacterium]
MERAEMVREYLRVLGLDAHECDFALLNELVARHVATFAFSSVGSLLGEDLPLDFESLYQRIVVDRRGGYCFQHNGLMYGVLEELGFSPTLYLARVIYNQDVHPGLTHRISMVEHAGQKYVLDVGFGPLGPRIAVPMPATEAKDGEKIFRIAQRRPGEYHVEVFKDEVFFSLYRFELARYGQSDCELGHFYSHRHPEATFVNHLVVSLLLERETRSLRDLEYSVITQSGTCTRAVRDSGQLRQLLVGEFGCQVTEDESRCLFDMLAT